MATYIGQNVYIRPNYIISLPEYDTKRNFYGQSFLDNKKNLKENSHKGKLSAKSQKELKNAVNWLVASAKKKSVYHKESEQYYTFKVNFVTLTLPDTLTEVTDTDFKEKLLNPFLTYLRKYKNLKNYIWKLEFQENGKLHAHLTTDSFIYWKDLRKIWNKRLIDSGYMDEFIKKFGHSDPNSTDVHSVYKVTNIAAYIAKYMAKNEQLTKGIKGRIWGCNYEISRNSKPKLFVWANEIAEIMKPLFNPLIEYKPIMSPPDSCGQTTQFGEIFFMKEFSWNLIKNEIKDIYLDTCHKIRNLISPEPDQTIQLI
jgi:hypothetical protein